VTGAGSSTGSGAFETLRVYGGTPFAWRRHLDRLAGAADDLGIPMPDRNVLRRGVDEVLAADGLVEARVRITLLADPADGADVIIGAGALAPHRTPARVVTAAWPRNDRAAMVGVKSTSYAENVRAFADARARGADECVFANTRGELCEATGSNVFLVTEGVVRTPPTSSGCLMGVTRSLVLELAASDGIPVDEHAIAFDALTTADEVFLSSTTREVLPIGEVDGHTPGTAPGPVTRRLAARFADLVARDLDP
jgi:branched-chain amino acid aminotransferase